MQTDLEKVHCSNAIKNVVFSLMALSYWYVFIVNVCIKEMFWINGFFFPIVHSCRARWTVLKQQKTRATSTSRLASMRMPSSATRRPSVCVPMSRSRTYRHFIRTEQLPLNSRLGTTV